MKPLLSRREVLALAAKMSAAALGAGATAVMRAQPNRASRRIFDLRDYGAAGDGTTLDTAALQRAIDEAAAASNGSQVLVRGGKRYLIGAVQLKGAVELHLADDAELLVSTDPQHFAGRAAITALEAHGLRITGTGSINGRAHEFMERYDEAGEWWRPKAFRPRLCVLTGCKNLEIRDLTFRAAPSWTLHLMGCEQGLIDGIKIRNDLDVPNCDGIDPDHCRDLEIKNCDIVCGDDPIVIKTTRPGAAFGPSSKIRVSDCLIETRSSGVKIGTETTQDVSDVRFERCEIKSSGRGLCIQLRDEGHVSNIEFRDIRFKAQRFAEPWWGHGEAISFTAIPRTPSIKVGTISDVRVVNISGRAENSARISGSTASRIRNVRLENVAVTLDRWTKFPGGTWDNRPTTAIAEIEQHGTPGYSIRHADEILLRKCKLSWGENRPDNFTHALEAEKITGLNYSDFAGEAAHPERDKAIVLR